MAEKDREYVLRMTKEHKVKFIRLWFADILGFLKSQAITVEELETTLDEGTGFDGSSIEGLARIEESDVIAMPDPSTFALLPGGLEGRAPVARMFCDILNPDGTPHQGDPRGVLRRMLKKAADMGYTYEVGPELEYFYFRSSSGKPEVIDEGGYFDLTPNDVASELRKETVMALEELGIEVECTHHEVAPSQHEIDLRHTDALTMADSVMTYRLTVKDVALRQGVYATFMPKPILGVNGSGMHVHQSLFKGNRNAFFDPNGTYHLSEVAQRFLAGLLKYVPEFLVVTNQWVNSYKRLVPGYEAPAYLSWGQRNRSALVRVPMYKPGKEAATRLELRCPDPACNPYLAFAVMLGAGLKGMEEKTPLPEPVEDNIFEMGPALQESRDIKSLPANLYAAILAAEKSALLREVLGDHMFEKFLANKRIEWKEYAVHVTEYELERYLPRL